jgi:hypothetical protein
MSTHQKKFEVIALLRILSVKYSEMGEQTKAIAYIDRAEKLTLTFISNPDNIETL